MSQDSSAAGKPRPRRGEIWRVDLQPTRGREMQSRKSSALDTRPVLVLTQPNWGTPGVLLCAPVSNYNAARDTRCYWRVVLFDTPESGLTKVCCADVGQMRVLDLSRFVSKDGRAHPAEVAAVAGAVARSVGYIAPSETAAP